jgi:hypothetical protein
MYRKYQAQMKALNFNWNVATLNVVACLIKYKNIKQKKWKRWYL